MLWTQGLFPASCSGGGELGDRAVGVTGSACKGLHGKDGVWDLMVVQEFLGRDEGREDGEKQEQQNV